eukprot:TRINITY_DN487_c0_g1_i1.p1 TRINITY_DN487_c0_g1~~TRINITY_DN487_c0_g1_i1.p1  ORF type:complete len:163 (+),score=47.86 TRINITY_DN487_c0_g1_i1:25-513(+)
MGIPAFIGRVLLVSVFAYYFAHHVQNFDFLAQEVVGPKVVGLIEKAAEAAKVDISKVPLDEAGPVVLGIALFYMGAGSLLSVFNFRIGFLFLILFLVPVTLIIHPFWEAGAEAKEGELRSFLLNTSIVGGLMALLFAPSAQSSPKAKASNSGPAKKNKNKKN